MEKSKGWILEEEVNFLKGCLLVAEVIPNGLREFLQQQIETSEYNEGGLTTKATESLLSMSGCAFQELYTVVEQIDMNESAMTGVNHLMNAREEFLKNARKDQLSNGELETILQEVHKGFTNLKLPLEALIDVSERKAFSNEEELTIYEQLSKQTRTVCQLVSSQSPIIYRTKELSSVLSKLEEIKSSNTPGNTTVYISGPQGSGKSELAKQVAIELYNQHINATKDSIMVAVLDAETEDSLLYSYIRLAKDTLGNSLHIKMAATAKGLTGGQKIRLLKCIVEQQLKSYSKWIIVIDHVHSLEEYSSYWPKPGSEEWGRGQVIVTSTDTNATQSSSKQSGHVTISRGMQPSEAIELLCGVSGVTNKDFALEVAEMLEFQPLALNCAASFVKNHSGEKKNKTWKTYLGNFKKQKKLYGEELCHESGESYFELSQVAMKMLFDQLSAQHELIPSIVFLLYIFDPFPVSKDVILNCFKDLDDTDVGTALQILLGTNILSTASHQDNSELLYSRYSKMCKKTLIEFELPDTRKTSILGSAIRAVGLHMSSSSISKNVVNDTTYYHSFVADKLMSRVGGLKERSRKELVGMLEKCGGRTAAFDVFVDLGKQCQLIQSLENAKISFELAKEIMLRNGEVRPSLEPKLYSVLRRLGDVGDMADVETRRYFDEALKICRNPQNDIDGLALAEAIDDLGDVTISFEETTTAKKLYMEALQLRSQAPDCNRVGYIHISWFKLGNVYAMENDFQRAKEHYEKALEVWENDKSEEVDCELVKILTCAGAMSICVNEFPSAMKYLERAMKLEERLFSPHHPCRLSTIKNASNACKALGDTERAEKLLKLSLEISEKVMGWLDDGVAQVYSELGLLCASKSDWETAKEYHSRSLEIRENTLCQLHPDIADSCCDLGNAYSNLGELEKAKTFLERSLGIRGLLFRKTHPDVGTSFFRLGELYNKLDDHQTGLNLLENAVEIRTRNFGIQGPETLASIKLLGNSFARLGQLKRAKDLYQTVADELCKLKDNSTDIVQISSSLAEVSLGLGEVDQAKEQYKRAIEVQKKVTGGDHPEMAPPLVGLALVHEHCKELKEAKSLLEKALAIYKRNVRSHSTILVTEMHLKRVMAKIPQLRCLVM